MKIQATLNFITPCFCAGANRLEAEIRAPSIRGELRWWFRCLGGTKQAEDAIFGSVAGNGCASLLQVRVSDITRANEIYSPTHTQLTDPGAYLHYYLDVPPQNGQSRLWTTPPDPKTRRRGVPRRESCLPAGSSFVLRLHAMRRIPDEYREQFKLAICAMLRFGSIGFRHTRGFGAWNWSEEPIFFSGLEQLTKEVQKVAPDFSFWFAPNAANNRDGLLNQIETRLKAIRKPSTAGVQGFPARNPTALGHTGAHGRQASAVRFRPVQIQTKKGDTQYRVVIFQAPDRVLGANVSEPRRIVPEFIPK